MDINIISKKEEKERTWKKGEHVKRSDRREREKEGNKIGNKEHIKDAELVIYYNYGIESCQPHNLASFRVCCVIILPLQIIALL